jgi:hypothetical protein
MAPIRTYLWLIVLVHFVMYKISNENLSKLQETGKKSHACGTGEEVPTAIVKLLLLKIQSLSYGHSGIQIANSGAISCFYKYNDILNSRLISRFLDLGDLAFSTSFINIVREKEKFI